MAPSNRIPASAIRISGRRRTFIWKTRTFVEVIPIPASEHLRCWRRLLSRREPREKNPERDGSDGREEDGHDESGVESRNPFESGRGGNAQSSHQQGVLDEREGQSQRPDPDEGGPEHSRGVRVKGRPDARKGVQQLVELKDREAESD